MAQRIQVKRTFEPAKTIKPISTNGRVALSQDARMLVSLVDDDVLITELFTGEELARIEGDGEPITALSLTPSASHLILCSRSLSMRIYSISSRPLSVYSQWDPLDPKDSSHDGYLPHDPYSSGDSRLQSKTSATKLEYELIRTLKPHSAPVIVSAVDRTGTLLATGGADSIVKVWDIRGGFVTHTFHGHSGLISALHFFEIPAVVRDFVDHDTLGREGDLARSKKRKRESHIQETAERWRLASGDENGKIRIWDLHKRSSVAVLESHTSVVRSLDFSHEKNYLLSGGRDQTFILWRAEDWTRRQTFPVLEKVESAGFLLDGRYAYMGGQSGRLRIWKIFDTEIYEEVTPLPPTWRKPDQTWTQTQWFEEETKWIQEVLYHRNLPFIVTVHTDQSLQWHDITCLVNKPERSRFPGGVMDPCRILRRMCGNLDQVVDVAYVGRYKSELAVATNSEDVRIYDLVVKKYELSPLPSDVSEDDRPPLWDEDTPDAGGNYPGGNVELLKGHKDVIITMDVDWSGNWLATGSKDNTARLWRIDPVWKKRCFCIFTGHVESLGAVALPKKPPAMDSKEYRVPLRNPPPFLITGSQDLTIKKWEIPRFDWEKANGYKGPKEARALFTRKAHDKDINAIAIDPSSELFASASQDRTAKIWNVKTGKPYESGVLRGHRRGVWSIAFSPAGANLQVHGATGGSGSKGYVLTGSGDRTVKIWSLADLTCLLTMEGHTNSVLKVLWMPSPREEEKADKCGPMVASSGGDGLVKVWEANTGECIATLDNHTDRVWALTAREPTFGWTRPGALNEVLASGGADGVITLWKDTTSETFEELRVKENERIELDQRLMNFVHGGNYREAIALALQLDQPGRLLSIFKGVVEGEDFERGSFTGKKGVDDVIASLADGQIYRLLLRCRDWNTNARNALVAQRVLRAIVAAFDWDRLSSLRANGTGKGPSLKEILEGLRVYGERHFNRTMELWDESFLLEFTLKEMDAVAGGALGIGEVNGNGYEHDNRKQQVYQDGVDTIIIE